MGRFLGPLTVLAVAVVVSTTAGASPLRESRAVARGPLETGFLDAAAFAGRDSAAAFARARAAGAGYARLMLYWRGIAPAGNVKPAGFDATNPADPRYNWSGFDQQIRLAAENRLEPIVIVFAAPEWAERRDAGTQGTGDPNPAELASFGRAAALRYSGTFGGLPRIRYWQVWNEPNLDVYLTPQLQGTSAVSPEVYRALVNAFAGAVHAVRPDNAVLAGGQAPFGKPLTRRVQLIGVSPLRFMREMLCMTGRANPRPSCNAKVEFDIWTHHPYTAGGPTKQAAHPDDASIGDLPEMRRLLEAADTAGHIVSRQPLRFWVTEFSWDSNPPDPNGVPARLHARWVAEAMYRMWQSGVSVVVWFLLRDDPLTASRNQSGLYLNSGGNYANDRPKLALTAFRFPFVAFPSGRRIFVWGRTPSGAPGSVRVEHQAAGGWFPVATLRANRFGIFSAKVTPHLRLRGSLRARFGGDTSLAFSLAKPPDFRLQTPFGD